MIMWLKCNFTVVPHQNITREQILRFVAHKLKDSNDFENDTIFWSRYAARVKGVLAYLCYIIVEGFCVATCIYK